VIGGLSASGTRARRFSSKIPKCNRTVIYAVAANYAARMKEHSNSHLIKDELLRIMQSATLEVVH
jgi:hypothetical protein